MIYKVFFFLFIAFYSMNSFSAILFDISLITNSGIDEKLVLTHELHSQEVIDEGSQIRLKIKNNLMCLFTANFIPELDIYGPSDLLKIKIEVQYEGKSSIEEVEIHLEELFEKRVVLSDKKVELLIKIKSRLI